MVERLTPARPLAWIAGALLGLVSASAVLADEPVYLIFEGRLHTIAGPHAAPESEVTFRLTNRAGGGDVLWEQGPQTVALHDGYFQAVLGDGAPLTLDLFGGPRWLEVDCPDCAGSRRFRIERRGEAIAILGSEKPVRPGPLAAKALLRNQRLHDQRAYPTGIVPGGAIAKAYAELAASSPVTGTDPTIEAPSSSLTQGQWLAIGPSKVTNGQTSPTGDVSGRVNSIAVHPTDPNIVYACGAQGGVWKSTNAGTTWMALTDTLPSLATGAIAISTSNPSILYLGTGEANLSIDSYWGAGIWKSTDGGANWAPTGPIDPNRAPLNSAAIAQIVVHPTDPNVVIAAVGTFQEGNRLFSGGIYRTTDGGATWARALGTGLPAGAVAATDVLFDPSNPNNVYAGLGYIGGSANNGVYKSTNGGASFGARIAGGLPSTNVGRINLGISKSSPLIVYAAHHSVSASTLLGLYRSADGGASWTFKSSTGYSCNTQCWYDLVVAVHPTDPNTVFLGGVNLYRSTNGGNTFTSISTSSGTTGGLHADQHALFFAPSLPTQLWSGNDGGVWRTDDPSPASPNWVNRNGNLALLQFQSVAVPPADPNVAYGGTQDNGTIKYTGSTIWNHIQNGDGGQTAVDFVTPATVYHTYFNVSFERSDNSGSTWATKQSGLNTADPSEFYVPVEMDPTNPAVLYLGTNKLYRTPSRGDSWSAISPDLSIVPGDPNNLGDITAIGVGKNNASFIYTGSSNAQVYATSNLGGAWTDVKAAPLPTRTVATIAVSPVDANIAFVGYSGFDDPNNGNGHVFRTVNRGASWTDTTSNLPNMPVNQLVIDPVAPQMIYAATDIGPYASTNGGQTWARYAGGLPNVATFEIAVQQPNLLFTATHGRGMFQAFGCSGSGTTDLDADGIADFCDNCASGSNPAQTDADHDGFGAPCDCADADAAIHPGSPPPSDVAEDVTLADTGDLAWSGATLAQGYDVYRGGIGPTTHFAYNQTCLANTVPATTVNDATTPAIGSAFYYVVASRNCMAESGLGSQSNGTPRPNSSPCP
ncbi:MAG: hypothetical protein HY049_13560 [Acidobacteria bacterium]|nr:hypothetical protein [Acidobacteriota bacterium]